MIGLIQRLLQLAVLAVLAVAIWQPALVPQPVRPLAEMAHTWTFGSEVSWQSFSSTWVTRWNYLASRVPALAELGKSIPTQAPTITADSLMQLTVQTLYVEPAKKWEKIKHELTGGTSASVSGTAGK